MSFHVYSASQSGNNDYAMYMYAYVGTKVAKILVAILPDFDVGMKLLLAIHQVYICKPGYMYFAIRGIFLALQASV